MPLGKPCGVFCRACPKCRPGEVFSETVERVVEPRPKPKRRPRK